MTDQPDLDNLTDAFAALERSWSRVQVIIQHSTGIEGRDVTAMTFQLLKLHGDEARNVAARRLIEAAENSEEPMTRFWARVFTLSRTARPALGIRRRAANNQD